MVVPLNSPQPVFELPPLSDIPDEYEDSPVPGIQPNAEKIGPLQLPELVFGAAAFSSQYNIAEHLSSTVPLRTVRLALRYGIRAFDTSAYYGPSEIVLGAALRALAPEFPRESYQLLTKCGRYGATKEDFDYSPETIRKSVERSLARLNTTYLDVVYLHDIEFISDYVQAQLTGDHAIALTPDNAGDYGLALGQEAKVWGAGDRQVLAAVAELRKLQKKGFIKYIGLSGYPLPTLLRLALLVQHTELEGEKQPVDVLMSYSHLHLQNDTFKNFVAHFHDRARIPQLLTASPLNMGLLTPSPPIWHPAPPVLRDTVKEASAECEREGWEDGLVNLALGFAYREAKNLGLPTVVGLSKPSEVHETIRIWRELRSPNEALNNKRAESEKTFQKRLGELRNYSWASP
ncbi:Aldo/keto reductase [Irpex rosettiformis]|uniref:Aldo/keto reductase n=1 Tax=Irpex rosettiformis TaxID=378272 RepID=A0ACB8UE01_9APHY|nr:Aldo/keto reductase [Irpex rosettiformis]